MDDKKKKEKIICLSIIIVLIVFLVVLGIIFLFQPDKELRQYMKLIEVHDGTYTYVDINGKIRTYDGYSNMSDFYYDTACVSRKNAENEFFSEDALITKNEKIIVDYNVYDSISQIVNGKYYKVEKDGKAGVINYKGEVIVPLNYDYVMISTNSEENEYIFLGLLEELQSYDYINENGKVFFNSSYTSSLGNITYCHDFNSEDHTVVQISLEESEKYFDLVTGEELFVSEENVDFDYHIQIKENSVVIYNKDMSIKQELDTSNCYSVSRKVYFDEYIVLEEKFLADGKRGNKYIVYDSNYEEIYQTENPLTLLKNSQDQIYFVTKQQENIQIENKNGKVIKIPNYELVDQKQSDFLVVKRLDNELYDIYDLKGNLVLENTYTYHYENNFLSVTKQSEEEVLLESILLENKQEILINDTDTVLVTKEHIIIENAPSNSIKILDQKGKVIVEAIEGNKDWYNDEYIAVIANENYQIYEIKTGKIAFEFSKEDFVQNDTTMQFVELKSGYYRYNGELIFKSKTSND